MMRAIIQLSPDESEQACREISLTLPEWFGIPEASERYAKGVKERLSFGYVVDGSCLGMLALEFPFSNAATIYWMAVRKDSLYQGIGKALLRHAEMVCLERQVHSLSVETLSPKEKDRNYLNTFKFYIKEGFRPLFELNPYGPDYLMVYLNKVLSPALFEWVDLTHKLSENIPSWDGDCGFKHTDVLTYDQCETECKFLVQRLELLAGIGTHLDAPAHCFPTGKTVEDLSLQTLMSPCIVVDTSQEAHEQYCVEMDVLKNFERQNPVIWKQAFVVFHTGWSKFWNQPEKYRNHYKFPSISKEVAEYLLSEGVAGIGIDTLSPDRPDSGYPVHQIMLGAGKYLVENIANAERLPAVGSFAFVMPLRITGGTEAPVRLFAMFSNPEKLLQTESNQSFLD